MQRRRMRGMHDVPTLQGRGRNGRRVGGTREQIAAEIARLEQARQRLAHEQELWQRNLVRVEQQLHDTEQRLALLRQSLEALTDEGGSRPAPRNPPRPRNVQAASNEPAAWEEVAFEY